MAKSKIPEKYAVWITARKQYRLTHAQVQMARELGLNPHKLGKLDNHKQEPWKIPLPEFIEQCYFKRFGKERPDQIKTIEEVIKIQAIKKEQKKQNKILKRQARTKEANNEGGNELSSSKHEC